MANSAKDVRSYGLCNKRTRAVTLIHMKRHKHVPLAFTRMSLTEQLRAFAGICGTDLGQAVGSVHVFGPGPV